jgi:hypothetical protein
MLYRLSEKHERFTAFARSHHIIAHEGLQLRDERKRASEPLKEHELLEEHPELAGEKKLVFEVLRRIGRTFAFPQDAFSEIGRHECFVRAGRAKLAIAVSSPPHLVVDASRRFAVFSEEFIAVPPRQIGIAGPSGTEDLLRALGIYLSSDFCIYHQFLVSPKWGIDQNLADLDTLKKLPVPLRQLSRTDVADWSNLYKKLASLSAKKFTAALWQQADESCFASLILEINSRVFELLALRPHECRLIEDFVHLNMGLKQGTVTQESMGRPQPNEIRLYITTLRASLDSFLSSSQGFRHKIETVTAGEYALFSVSLQRTSSPAPPSVFAADQSETRALLAIRDRLRRKHSQWVYFDRSLKIYDHGVLYHFKPMQRIHWSRRQAILDADEIIAETLTEGTGS